MKHVFYFVVGLIFSPAVLIVVIHSIGKEIIRAATTGYKIGKDKCPRSKGTEAWDGKEHYMKEERDERAKE